MERKTKLKVQKETWTNAHAVIQYYINDTCTVSYLKLNHLVCWSAFRYESFSTLLITCMWVIMVLESLFGTPENAMYKCNLNITLRTHTKITVNTGV